MINIGYPYSAHICTRSSFANFETVYHYRDWCTTNNPKYEFWQKLRNLKNLLPTLGATSSSTLHITKYQYQRDHLVGQSTILAGATLPPPGWKDPTFWFQPLPESSVKSQDLTNCLINQKFRQNTQTSNTNQSCHF